MTKKWYQFKVRRDHKRENTRRKRGKMNGSFRSNTVITEFSTTMGSPVSTYTSKLSLPPDFFNTFYYWKLKCGRRDISYL